MDKTSNGFPSLDKLWDLLSEDIVSISNQQMVLEITADYGSPEIPADEVKKIVLSAVNRHRQRNIEPNQ